MQFKSGKFSSFIQFLKCVLLIKLTLYFKMQNYSPPFQVIFLKLFLKRKLHYSKFPKIPKFFYL